MPRMRRSDVRVYVHFVWATWDRLPLIPAELTASLHAVIASVCEKHSCEVFAIGGMPDHRHLFVNMSATISIADLMHDAKGASSRWMNEQLGSAEAFRWQGRYGAFSVSPHERSRITEYIRNQAQHHADGTLWPTAEQFDTEFDKQ